MCHQQDFCLSILLKAILIFMNSSLFHLFFLFSIKLHICPPRICWLKCYLFFKLSHILSPPGQGLNCFSWEFCSLIPHLVHLPYIAQSSFLLKSIKSFELLLSFYEKHVEKLTISIVSTYKNHIPVLLRHRMCMFF